MKFPVLVAALAAGHFAHHHGLLGTAAGCVIGRHHAKAREQQALQPASR